MSAADNDRMVFLYRDDQWIAYRWLVDDTGHSVDAVAFRKSPPEWTEVDEKREK
jgi:hypothetical protein